MLTLVSYLLTGFGSKALTNLSMDKEIFTKKQVEDFTKYCLGLKLTPFIKGVSFKPRQYLVKSSTCFLVKISLSIERFVNALLPNPVKR